MVSYGELEESLMENKELSEVRDLKFFLAKYLQYKRRKAERSSHGGNNDGYRRTDFLVLRAAEYDFVSNKTTVTKKLQELEEEGMVRKIEKDGEDFWLFLKKDEGNGPDNDRKQELREKMAEHTGGKI